MGSSPLKKGIGVLVLKVIENKININVTLPNFYPSGASIFLITLYFQYPILISTLFGLIHIWINRIPNLFSWFRFDAFHFIYWELYKNGARRRGLLHKQR